MPCPSSRRSTSQGNRFEICGASHGDVTMRDLISAQMDGVYFPVTIHEFAADITYRDLNEGEFEIGGLAVKTMLLSHPGNCLGYRVTYNGRSLCYVTDNELYDAGSPQRSEEYMDHLIEFIARHGRAGHRLHLHRRDLPAEDGLGTLLGESGRRAGVTRAGEEPLHRPPRPRRQRRHHRRQARAVPRARWPSRARRPTSWRRGSERPSSCSAGGPGGATRRWARGAGYAPASVSMMQAAGSIWRPTDSPARRR